MQDVELSGLQIQVQEGVELAFGVLVAPHPGRRGVQPLLRLAEPVFERGGTEAKQVLRDGGR